MKKIAGMLCVAMGLAFAGTAAQAQEITLRSADIHPDGYPTVEAVKYMGQLLSERNAMGAIRARKVADVLIGLGVFAERITVKPARTLPADGVNDPWNRRVEVRVR